MKNARKPDMTQAAPSSEAGLSVAGLYHTTRGSGPPLLVIHGAMGLDHTYLLDAFAPLADHNAVHWVDLRGHGRSQIPATPEEWADLRPASWAADLEALRRALGVERWVVLGHSYGGAVAQEYALAYGDRVAGLVLVGTYPAFDYVGDAVAAVLEHASPAQAAALHRLLANQALTDEEFRSAWQTVLPLFAYTDAAPVVRACEHIRFRARTFQHALAGTAAFSTVGRLGAVSAPVLVVDAVHDWIAPPERAGNRLVEELPNAERVIFENSGHYPFLEEPDRFVSVLTQWLALVPR